MDDAGASLQAPMSARGRKACGRRRPARPAATRLRLVRMPQRRTAAIAAMAKAVRAGAENILAANARDVAAAQAAGLAAPMVDRLVLDEARLEAIARALETIAAIPDPLGSGLLAEIGRWDRLNGLDIARVRMTDRGHRHHL